jgi:hypothetical protein
VVELPALFEAVIISVEAFRDLARKSRGPSDLKRAVQAMGSPVVNKFEQPHGQQ